MGRNTARGNSKRKGERPSQAAADRPEREKDLEETKKQARERIARASSVIESMSEWALEHFEELKAAGDLEGMQKLQDFLTRMIRQDMQILSKKLAGGQGRGPGRPRKGVNGAGAAAEEQGERSLDAFSA